MQASGIEHSADRYSRKTQRGNAQGFTLIEVMVAVVIIGILASTALGSYQRMLREAKRMEAKAALQDSAQRLQRCYSLYGRYDAGDCAVHNLLADPQGVLPEPTANYRLRLTQVSLTEFTLAADAHSANQLRDTACLRLTLDYTGAFAPSHCW